MNVRYYLNPTFTPGSPAQVDKALAQRVALQERSAYLQHVNGRRGETSQMAANKRGLEGIAYRWHEKGKGVVATDLLTSRTHTFASFPAFRQWAEYNRDLTTRFHAATRE